MGRRIGLSAGIRSRASAPPSTTDCRSRRSIVLQAAPNPAATEVRLRWSTALPGNGRLELRGPDGRLIRGFAAPLADAQVRWDGRDGQGRPVPAGVYWATLLRAGERLAAQRVIWLRAAP